MRRRMVYALKAKIESEMEDIVPCITGSSNGRTSDFESVNEGSIPSPVAISQGSSLSEIYNKVMEKKKRGRPRKWQP